MNAYEMALYGLSCGYQTIPVNNKAPLVKFAGIPITEQFIENHVREYMTATGLGVLCRGLWCMDFDVPKQSGQKSGIESLKELPYYEEFKRNASITWRQTTPSGGYHVIFSKNKGIEYKQHIGYLENLDIKANPNNYFLMFGSVTDKGRYELVGCGPVHYHYNGKLEKRIFSGSGNYYQQIMEKYSVKNALKDYDFSPLKNYKKSGWGKGKEAYNRIITGTSFNRNDDLFKAVSYAKTCNRPIEPLKCVIGTVKGTDVFTEAQWIATVNSALNR